MTEAGLNTVNLSALNTFQQIILFLLIITGSAIFVSEATVHVRRKAFERRFKTIIDEKRANRRQRRGSGLSARLSRSFSNGSSATRNNALEIDGVVIRGRVIKPTPGQEKATGDSDIKDSVEKPSPAQDNIPATDTERLRETSLDNMKSVNVDPAEPEQTQPTSPNGELTPGHIMFTDIASQPTRRHTRILSMSGVGARPNNLNHPRGISRPIDRIPSRVFADEKPQSSQKSNKWFPSNGFIARNSQFHNLSLEERELLGGVEYRAITLLEVIVPIYFVLWQLIGSVGIGAWIAKHGTAATKVNALNPWWVGAFIAVSAFNNSGMSLVDANMIAFQESKYVLITAGLLILAGNTCYPVFLRLIVWTLNKIIPDKPCFHETREAMQFLLVHPRRCYTNLFPSSHTWWLLATVISLNGTDWVAFEIFNIGNPLITTLPGGTRAIDGLFQAFAVRSGGFYVVSISQLRIALLILYVIMMYISVYPVSITMRNSNVYEERSLGIYAEADVNGESSQERDVENKPGLPSRLRRTLSSLHGGNRGPKESRSYFVRQQLRGQLAHDLWWIVLAVLFITLTETSNFERDPVDYSVFNVIFEVISAYGCVGISVGLPNVAYSFCGGWHKFSKLILCAVMLRGRHRGLPVAIDRAVLLPGEHLGAAEEEDAMIRMERGVSRAKAP